MPCIQQSRLAQLESTQEQQEQNFDDNIITVVERFDVQINNILEVLSRLIDQVSVVTGRLQ